MPEMLMPRLSESMQDGVIVRWLRDTGSAVERGDELVEIETDKATVTCEAEFAGVLDILAAEGDILPIGAPIARIGDQQARQQEKQQEKRQEDQPDKQPNSQQERLPADVRIKTSPLARRLAREKGVDLAAVRGTGPGGRIVRADIEAAATEQQEREYQAPELRGRVSVVDPSHTQRSVATRMSEAKRAIPEFTITTEIDMDSCVELRTRIMEVRGAVPTYNDMVVKAAALALREHPRVNGAYRDGSFELYGRINVGIAVATDDALLVPTVFDADTRGLTDLARTTRSLAERARDSQITPAELDGGTFTVSNLGMYGVSEFTAVINPPQAAILAVGAVQQQPRVRDGEVSAGHVMRATLTCDHRILYGADAAAFLARVRELLTQPVVLLLDERSAP